MRHLYTIAVIISAAFLANCTIGEDVSQNADSTDSQLHGSEIETDAGSIDLDQYLSRLSGVQVRGSGRYADIRVRGASSIEDDTTPLFIIDDVQVGKDFARIFEMVNMEQVKNIQVLNSSRATTRYGSAGAHGAIIISTEND